MRPVKIRLLVLAALFSTLLALGACGGENKPEPTSTVPATADPRPTETVPPATLTPPPASQPVAFSYAPPESQGLSAEALEELTGIVQGYFEEDKIVGAELLVIQNRQIVLHEVVGWQDRDEQRPLAPHTLFNIRSMSKPVVGTAAQMLIDDGKLVPDDRASQHLPAFDNPKSGEITVEHLLTHRSGLPLSLLESLDGYANLREVAQLAGEHGPDFTPGADFQYSDTGSEALGAVLEQVSGQSLDVLLQDRILTPLAMSDTFTLIRPNDPRTERVGSLYIGTENSWSLYWNPIEDEPIYPFTMGSQSLYSTPLDYARFLALWLDGGRVGQEQLLSPQAIERGLTPVSDMGYPTSFPGIKVYYGQMWMLFMDAESQELVAFGHNGSDGTWAWAWPERDLMVFYFTQSRGQTTGIRLEADIDRLLLNPGREPADSVPEAYKPYLGTYTTLSGPLQYQEFRVLVQNGHLALDLPNLAVVELEEPDSQGKWRLSIDQSVAISFVEDENGEVTAMRLHEAGQTFEIPRGTAPPEPSLGLEAVQKYLGTYRILEAEAGETVQVLFQNGRLALDIPDAPVILELYPPDDEEKWYVRLNPSVAIRFNESADGEVESFTSYSSEGELVRPKVKE